ncbi:sugar kinase [Spirilliplanes yamanashiensis]|uniref:Sugar kinase n=1 Tax=Spirilliplanes yamanashiensis TaxID=42233 RepID=A0A8J3Y5S0_9ACTN|nr:sugar kinase [Spirilliplanes yamanashiensis]MDP9819205.1 2-dehydro-3-deoxygluconokinase [Spirilliplanes yamanashiensis]GIJ01972.1 sugar kinase [Spirilliplanes yamanashiensis]
MTGRPAGGLVTLGETMGLVAADGIGPLEYARGFSFGIGGAESNVAVGVARLDGRATWIGRVGADATGDLVARRLAAEGVDTVAVRDPGFTGLMVRHRRSGGALHVDYHRAGSAGSRLAPADVPDAVVAAAGVLHVTGITPALSDSARDAVRHAVRVARAAGVPVSVDVNHRAKLWDRATAAPVLRELVEQADIVFAGPAEARLVLGGAGQPAGQPAAELARALAALGPAEAVVKDGANGCTAVIDGDRHDLPAVAVTVVDPVGAGDAFVAGYLTARLAGASPAERLRTAIAVGAYAVTVPGDCEGLPRRAELDAFLSTPDDDVAR